MKIDDDRTEEQKKTHRWLVIGTDTFFGRVHPGTKQFAAWACETETKMRKVLSWVEKRSDMKRVRWTIETDTSKYRPKGEGYTHIYIDPMNH